ncbi:MAG: glycosyltransferase family 4 protein [Chakrabartia sp.]
MTPKRVLHAHSTFSPGGKELRSVRLMNAFGAAAEHSILSAMPGELGARDAIHPDIRAVFPADAPALAGRPSLARYRALAAYMRGFDLVLTYNWGAMDMVAARRLFPHGCPPLIHHEDGFNADEATRRLVRRTLFRRFALPAAARIIVPSQALSEIARRDWALADDRLAVVPNGVETRLFAQPPLPGALPGLVTAPGDVVVGTVAGLRPVKNIPLLVRAVALLGTSVRLVVVGDGPERDAIAALARDLGMADRLLLTGHLPNPQDFLGRFDVFALSSDSEQAPLALMEAMAAGRAIAATDVGDVRAMVAPENQPFIVAGADGAALARALAGLVADPALRARLGAANQQRARTDFDAVQMIRRYGMLYGLPDPTVPAVR